MVAVPVTLATAAASTLVNGWLSGRIGSLRHKFKISIGDGGNEALLRRMRAQANFIESAPIFLILLGALELSGGNRWVLVAAALLFVLGRVSHAVGMDGDAFYRWRRIGMAFTGVPTMALALYAIVQIVAEILRR